MKFIAKTSAGLEEILAEELTSQNFKNVKILRRAVAFTGNLAELYRANYCLRTALRIIWPISEFTAINETELYNKIYEIAWDEYFDYRKSIYIDVSAYSNNFRHTGFLAQKTKDAVVDKFRDKFKIRPSVDKIDPDIVINVHIYEDNVTISLDSSGKTLNQRGYRKFTGEAPLNEVLASGMLLISKWDKKSLLIDPMCGSGTIPIEAAYIATNTPPGFNRKYYSFMSWNSFDVKDLTWVKERANADIIPSEAEIICSDLNPEMIDFAFNNAKNAGMVDYITFKKEDFFDSIQPKSAGLLICNPPYGERLQIEDIYAFYNSIGSHLKHQYMGFKAVILSMDNEAAKSIGLKSSKKVKLFNGPIECTYQEYHLYQGSRKTNNNSNLTDGK
ncbi:MAG: RNA methyltransferase [Bacteroidia bacterium]|nr:RNA methyltransferase [Bacteroidia bacterium]